MLLFFAIVLVILAIAVGALIAFANGMSDAPDADTRLAFVPVWIVLGLAALLLILHFWLRTHVVHW
jgi:hypothetical protein